jgi:hypothetical protein
MCGIIIYKEREMNVETIVLYLLIVVLFSFLLICSYKLTDKKVELIYAEAKIEGLERKLERVESKNKTAKKYFYHLKYASGQMLPSPEKDKIMLSIVYQAIEELK